MTVGRDTMRGTTVLERPAPSIEEIAYRKVTVRLVPFLFLCYIVAYLDRVNVGFAKLQMLSDLHFSETVYGLGAGIFFIGYFFFEVPSNVILHRVGARVWIARIMITWGVISGATLFVRTPWQFYGLRFLLGLAEAGFFPGIILYLTYWYPAHRRGKWTAAFMTAIPLAGVIGGPLSGWILKSLAGHAGLAGWQWMFLLEGIPSLIVGVLVLLYLDNGIRQARWLTEPEKAVLERNIRAESEQKREHSLREVFTDARVWWMSFIYFSFVMGLYGVTFWLPTIIKATGVNDPFHVGLLTAIPYFAAAVAMVVVARSADRRRERRWHLAVPAVLGSLGLALSTLYGHQTGLAMVMLTVGTGAALATLPTFWALPTAILAGTAAAAGIAMVNSIGNLAGFVAPYLVGWIADLTHSTNAGMYVLAVVLVAGAGLTLAVPAKLVNR